LPVGSFTINQKRIDAALLLGHADALKQLEAFQQLEAAVAATPALPPPPKPI
jgi:hypothetical protein